MQNLNPHNITTDKLTVSLFTEKNIEASVLRLDKIHPVISGNKWFKLQYYIEEAKQLDKRTIVTFGGAWSNHIIATAVVCKFNNLNSIGIIRGEEPVQLSSTLIQTQEVGMQLVFISRTDYGKKIIPKHLQKDEYYFISEGGFGQKGVEGAATILDHCVKESYTHICCAAGTGTMMAGLIKAVLPSQQVIGISVLKNNQALEKDVKFLAGKTNNFRISYDYHFGGYAKYQLALFSFMNEFYRQTNIPSDFVYTGKLFYGVSDLAKKNFFSPNSKLLIIHSGGLQGNASLRKGTLIF